MEKKKYEFPEMSIVKVELPNLLAGSFQEGETGGSGTGGGTGDGDDGDSY